MKNEKGTPKDSLDRILQLETLLRKIQAHAIAEYNRGFDVGYRKIKIMIDEVITS